MRGVDLLARKTARHRRLPKSSPQGLAAKAKGRAREASCWESSDPDQGISGESRKDKCGKNDVLNDPFEI